MMLSACNSRSGAQRGYRGRLSKEQMLDILTDIGPLSSYQWKETGSSTEKAMKVKGMNEISFFCGAHNAASCISLSCVI